MQPFNGKLWCDENSRSWWELWSGTRCWFLCCNTQHTSEDSSSMGISQSDNEQFNNSCMLICFHHRSLHNTLNTTSKFENNSNLKAQQQQWQIAIFKIKWALCGGNVEQSTIIKLSETLQARLMNVHLISLIGMGDGSLNHLKWSRAFVEFQR